MKASIIIPLKEINDYVREAIPHILNLDYENFEILIFPDNETQETFQKTRVIATGFIGPAQKRDLALKYAQGEILAFIDDDAYPKKDWLKNAIRYFDDPEIAAVCGPGITPLNNSIKQKASGWVCSSALAGPKISYRYFPGPKREVNDYPTMNFIIRKTDFKTRGGFDSHFWPGEDSELCLGLTKKMGKKIIYDPEIVVFHHRRPLFFPHLKQISRYGLHRGYFARILPETSRHLVYFIPSLFVLFLLFFPLAIFLSKIFSFSLLNSYLLNIYLMLNTLYLILLACTSFWVYLKERNFKVALLVIPGIFFTHFWYGTKFIQGFFCKDLKQ